MQDNEKPKTRILRFLVFFSFFLLVPLTTSESYLDFLTRGLADTIYCQLTGCTMTGNLTYQTIYAELSDLVDQNFAAINTKQPINLTTIDESYGLDISVYNITILVGGVYDIAAQPQVTAGAGQSGTFHMWLEKHNTTNWVNVSNSNVELTLSSQEEDVIPLISTLRLEANEKIRVMGSVSNTGIKLDAKTPSGEPIIPSIIFRIFKLG